MIGCQGERHWICEAENECKLDKSSKMLDILISAWTVCCSLGLLINNLSNATCRLVDEIED